MRSTPLEPASRVDADRCEPSGTPGLCPKSADFGAGPASEPTPKPRHSQEKRFPVALEEIERGLDFLDENATPSEVAEHEARVEADRVRMDALREEIEAMVAAAGARGERFDESVLDDERFASRFDRLVPNEDSVMLLASRWSIDPTRLEASEVGPGLGLIGEI